MYNNPLKFVDPTGMGPDGDIYNLNGMHIGNDGVVDNKVYLKRTTDDSQLSTSEAKQHTDIANEAPCVSNTINLTETTGITHEEFVQYAANVYNETIGMNANEKQKVASAMENRLEDYNGSFKKMLDKLMFNSDNHYKKMTELDRKPNNTTDYPPADKNDFSYGNVSTQNYRKFYNSSTVVRNNDYEMVGSVKATLIQLSTHKDIINNKKHWSGDGIKHTFRK